MKGLAMASLGLLASAGTLACGAAPQPRPSPVAEPRPADEKAAAMAEAPVEAAPATATPAPSPGAAPLCTTSRVPALIGPTEAVTSSGAYNGSYEAWQAFDDTASMWISGVFQTPAWLAYDFGSPQTITSYALHFNNGSLTSRAPRDWSLQGWSGSSWINVDTQTEQTGWLGVERRAYPVASPGSYSRYRLYVTDDNDRRGGVVVISVGGLELMGCAPNGL